MNFSGVLLGLLHFRLSFLVNSILLWLLQAMALLFFDTCRCIIPFVVEF